MNSLQSKRQSKSSARPKSWSRRGFSLLTALMVLSMLLGPSGATPALAANPAPVQLFYVTLPETDALTVLDAINSAANTPVYTYFSIAIGISGTYVYYDQWENGYAADIANPTPAEIYNAVTNPAGVQIWGNGVAADGCAPNKTGTPVVCTDGNDVLNAGDVIIPYNAVPIPRVVAPQSYVLDQFSTQAYNNNDGNTNWSGNWIETGDDGLATGGNIYINAGSDDLRFRYLSPNGGAGRTIDRGVDLSQGGGCANLSFTLGQDQIDANEDRLQLLVSSDGGSSYTALDTYTSSAAAGSKSYSLASYASANTRVRFLMLDNLESNEYWYVDDVRVDWNCYLPILFDGKDKVGASSSISMARATWASGSGTLNAFGHEMYSTSEWGTDFEAPVGTDTANAGQMFEYSALTIMAGLNNTTVQVDADADESYELNYTLQEGGSQLVPNIKQGAKVHSDKQIQVVLLTGDIGSSYASRDMSLLPIHTWDSSYWSPVGENDTPSYPTRLFLYNLSTNSSIYITCERYGVANTTLGPVAAKGVVTTDLVSGQGAHCFASDASGNPTADKFFAIGTVDTTNTAYDWSFTLYPQSFLSTEALVGLGLGKDPNNTSSTENGGPLWVTSTCSSGGTYVYVDWDNDGTADLIDTNGDEVGEAGSGNGILVTRLESVRLFKPGSRTTPYHQSGARVWSRTASGVGKGGDPGCKLALAWGEDPANATAGAPGLDVGTSIPPLRLMETTKSLEIVTDTAPLGVLNPGDTVFYNITIHNAGPGPINNVYVYDTEPANTAYVVNTTEWNTTGVAPWTVIPDDGSGTPFPLDVPGGVLLGNLSAGATFYVRFQVTLQAGDYEDITNCSVISSEAGEFTKCVTNPVATRDWGDLPDSYGTTAAANGPRHSFNQLILGALWDVEAQGQPTANADGDDNAYLDDEDGVTLVPAEVWTPLATVHLNVTVAGGSGALGGWFDWNNDGDITDAGEFVNFGALSAGTQQVALTIPSAWIGTPLYARLRLFDPAHIPGGSLDALDYLGFAQGGEVEDYYWTFKFDWGDLPDTYGTTFLNNGPRHSQGNLWLGALWDGEINGLPSVNADGDDLNNTDDEDGIFLSAFTQVSKQLSIQYTCSYPAGNGTPWLMAWFDWDGDGMFNATIDETTFNTAVTCDNVAHTLTFNWTPFAGDYTYGDSIYYRVRLFEWFTGTPAIPNGAFLGLYANGEVEDYYWKGPTAVTVSDPNAEAATQAILVSWESFDERQIEGFELYRSLDPEGQVRELIDAPKAQFSGQFHPASYSFEDVNVQPGITYTYWLKVLIIGGEEVWMQPASASLGSAELKFYLPVVVR